MTLTVLLVAYPFATVGADAVGGAEQVLSTLDRGLVACGHRSLVIACAGSEVAGEHIAILRAAGEVTVPVFWAIHAHVRRALHGAIAGQAPDVVHLHGADAMDYLPPPGVPALVALHLPPAWYPPGT